MNNFREFVTKISIYIHKYIYPYNILLILGAINVAELYFYGLGITLSGAAFTIWLVIEIFLPKLKRYQFKARQSDCKEFLRLNKLNFPEYDYGSVLYIEEIYDSQNSFLYTLVLVALGSDYRVLIDETELYNKPNLPLHIFEQKKIA